MERVSPESGRVILAASMSTLLLATLLVLPNATALNERELSVGEHIVSLNINSKQDVVGLTSGDYPMLVQDSARGQRLTVPLARYAERAWLGRITYAKTAFTIHLVEDNAALCELSGTLLDNGVAEGSIEIGGVTVGVFKIEPLSQYNARMLKTLDTRLKLAQRDPIAAPMIYWGLNALEVQRCVDFLGSDDDYLATCAADALHRRGLLAVEVLLDSIKHSSVRIRKWSVSVLARIGLSRGFRPRVSQGITERLASERDERVRGAIFDAVALVGAPLGGCASALAQEIRRHEPGSEPSGVLRACASLGPEAIELFPLLKTRYAKSRAMPAALSSRRLLAQAIVSIDVSNASDAALTEYLQSGQPSEERARLWFKDAYVEALSRKGSEDLQQAVSQFEAGSGFAAIVPPNRVPDSSVQEKLAIMLTHPGSAVCREIATELSTTGLSDLVTALVAQPGYAKPLHRVLPNSQDFLSRVSELLPTLGTPEAHAAVSLVQPGATCSIALSTILCDLLLARSDRQSQLAFTRALGICGHATPAAQEVLRAGFRNASTATDRLVYACALAQLETSQDSAGCVAVLSTILHAWSRDVAAALGTLGEAPGLHLRLNVIRQLELLQEPEATSLLQRYHQSPYHQELLENQAYQELGKPAER